MNYPKYIDFNSITATSITLLKKLILYYPVFVSIFNITHNTPHIVSYTVYIILYRSAEQHILCWFCFGHIAIILHLHTPTHIRGSHTISNHQYTNKMPIRYQPKINEHKHILPMLQQFSWVLFARHIKEWEKRIMWSSVPVI